VKTLGWQISAVSRPLPILGVLPVKSGLPDTGIRLLCAISMGQ